MVLVSTLRLKKDGEMFKDDTYLNKWKMERKIDG